MAEGARSSSATRDFKAMAGAMSDACSVKRVGQRQDANTNVPQEGEVSGLQALSPTTQGVAARALRAAGFEVA
jgi:hypothetical protein